MLKNILKISNILSKKNSSSLKMEVNSHKSKYDGRSKKRAWQERKTDQNSKIIKLDTNIETVERIKRRKYAMLLGYCGVDYYGMQRNPQMPTIEEDLFKALYKTNHINEENYNTVQNMQFQRAARTDKGVSAVRQVVSLKLPENVDLEKINGELPEIIRIFGIKKVTKGFNSKTNCDGRTYSYTLPTVAFSDKESNFEQNGYRLDDETFHRINKIAGLYVGTKNFHNFTSKKSFKDPSANRYIKSFHCERPFVRNDVEFAVLKVQGQSFMLHQIRKMVGLLLAIIKNYSDESILQQAFGCGRINIPRAPGLGLLLEFVHYDRYDNRYGSDGIHEKLTWEECDEDIMKFKEKYILPVITNKEIADKDMVIWLNKLSWHKFDDFDKIDDEDADGGDDIEEGDNDNKN